MRSGFGSGPTPAPWPVIAPRPDPVPRAARTGGRGKADDGKIEDGKFRDGQVTFAVTRERGDMKIVTKYTAKVDGDTLKGTAASERNGKEQKQEFEAKRDKVKD